LEHDLKYTSKYIIVEKLREEDLALAKLKFWLIPGIVLGLVLCLTYSPGWAATNYVLRTTPSIPVKLGGDGKVNVPLMFNSTEGLQNFTLRVTYKPAYLTPPSDADIVTIIKTAFPELFVKAHKQTPETVDDTNNVLMIAACVKADSATALKPWSAKSNKEFLTIPFTATNSVTATTPTNVTIDGFAGKGQELSQTTAAITFSQNLCTVSANLQGANLPNSLSYTLRLWGGPDNVDYRKEVSTPSAPTSWLDFTPVKPGDYWLGLEGCNGYKCNSVQIPIGPSQTAVSASLTLERIKGRVALVRKIVGKNLQLNFAYRDFDNEIIDWPTSSTLAENVKLTLKFFTNGNTDNPGTEFTFNPNGESCTLEDTKFIVTPHVVVNPTSETSLFGTDISYISMTVDPAAYYLSKTVVNDTTGTPKYNRYTCSFAISTSTSAAPTQAYTDVAKLKMDVDIPIASVVSDTKASIGQAVTSFTGNESQTAKELKIKSNFYLDNDGTAGSQKVIETTFNAAAMSTNYLKVAGTGEGTTNPAVFVDLDTLSTKRFNLAVELIPCESDANITVVSINFSDELGNSYEYDPDPNNGDRASAGALEFDVPLHKSIQKIYIPQYTASTSEALCEEIYTQRLITLKSQDDSVGNTEYVPPEAGAPDRYGIYFQRIGHAPELFIPNGADGESISVIYNNGLFFGHLISKHSSSWSNVTTEDAKKMPIIKSITAVSSHKKADHWYECFIQSVLPRFLFK